MIRLFKDQARLLLAIMVCLKRLRGEGAQAAAYDAHLGSLLEDAIADSSVAIEVRSQLTSMSLGNVLRQLDMDNFIQQLVEGLTDESDAGDVKLINEIVELLQLPFTGNRLSSDTLDALRRAVLRPSELAAFQKASREGFTCTTCKHTFQSRELGVLERGPNNNIMMRCLRCSNPQYSTCRSCGGSAPLVGPAADILRHDKLVRCECREVKKESKSKSFNNEVVRRNEAGPGVIEPAATHMTQDDFEVIRLSRMQQEARALREIIRATPPPRGLRATPTTTWPQLGINDDGGPLPPE